MKKITLHWTAGLHYPSEHELSRYPFCVDKNGRVYEGPKPPEVNRSPLGGDYYRHCGGFNSDNIGIALCGMHDAQEIPFEKGSYPVTRESFYGAVRLAADLCETYSIKVTRNTVFMHSEVLPRFGRGNYKWDVNWLPGMDQPGDPVKMGDYFRKKVQKELNSRKTKMPAWWVRLIQAFNRRSVA